MKRVGFKLGVLGLVTVAAVGCNQGSDGLGANVGSQAGSAAGYKWFDRIPGGSTLSEWAGRKAGEQVDQNAQAKPASAKMDAATTK